MTGPLHETKSGTETQCHMGCCGVGTVHQRGIGVLWEQAEEGRGGGGHVLCGHEGDKRVGGAGGGQGLVGCRWFLALGPPGESPLGVGAIALVSQGAVRGRNHNILCVWLL